MGVPKFFRWISARYPCINQVICGDEVPKIDHLYLDMNGILHTCSHPDDDSYFASEETIFKNIEQYIQFIVQLIKPHKTLFLAVDGVAPRAKMTQQRARRFQSAQDMCSAKQAAEKKGVVSFDPCLISPGTEFMDRLHTFLKQFVREQVNANEVWRRMDVILSGHDCPGEGEHKIREFMAYRRSQPNYRPNDRHCIYGMDADLIFLGLTTHEPNMCILRENIVKSRSCVANEMPFCITYLSLLREYIDIEFKSLKDSLPFPYDLERIIDDWIFMAFLLGNDFIPHIPNLHIHAESLLVLWDTYHVVLPQLDGYLVEYGRLNLQRFHRYLEELSKFEQSWFEEREADHRWMRGRQGAQLAKKLRALGKDPVKMDLSEPQKTPEMKLQGGAPPASDLCGLSDLTNFFGPASDLHREDALECLDETLELLDEGVIADIPCESVVPVVDVNKGNATENAVDWEAKSRSLEVSEDPVVEDGEMKEYDEFDEGEMEDDEDLDAEDELIYRMHRRDYYSSKLKIQSASEQELKTALMPLVRDYVRMLQWILNYYFIKVADWDFVFKYHYAPFACDLKLYTEQFAPGLFSTDDMDWAEFNPDSSPVLPFAQQLMILPADCAYIVPAPYRPLMTSSTSPLAEFFPKTFETDINGKKSSWEAVVLIPFLDEDCLFKAMEPLNSLLSDAENKRNKHKSHLFFRASPYSGRNSNTNPVVKIKHNFYRDHLVCTKEALRRFYTSPSRCIADSFPSLSRLNFTAKLLRVPVHVFTSPSQLDSMALMIDRSVQSTSHENLDRIAHRILGRPTRLRWPHCAVVMPVRLMSSTTIWELKDYNISPGQPLLEIADSFQSHISISTRHVDGDLIDLSEEKANGFNKRTQSEQDWFKSRVVELERYLRIRRAILFDSTDQTGEDTETVEPIIVFSRQFKGWSIVHDKKCCAPNNKGKFVLLPMFASSRAANGAELDLKKTKASSCWFRSSRDFRGRGRRSCRLRTMPCMQIEPAHGLCDGLDLDLLDLLVDGLPAPSPLDRLQISWNFSDRMPLQSIFRPGQIVFSFSAQDYGHVGEVVLLRIPHGTLTVRFYPNLGGSADISTLKQEWKTLGDGCNLVISALADSCGLPSAAVARLTGSIWVDVIDKPKTVAAGGEELSGEPQSLDQPGNNDMNPPETVIRNNKPDSCSKRRLNIGLNLIRNKTLSPVLGWSRYCPTRHTWMFSKNTLNLLRGYKAHFPKIVDFIMSQNWNNRSPIDASALKEEVNAVVEFLNQSGCWSAPVVPHTDEYLDADTVNRLRALIYPGIAPGAPFAQDHVYQPTNWAHWNKTPPVICTPESLYVPISAGVCLYPTEHFLCASDDGSKDKAGEVDGSAAVLHTFHLLDRVVFARSGQTVPLGLFGTVIGLVTSDMDRLIEVLFDKSFPGAIEIRGSGPCCAVVHPSSLIRLPRATPARKIQKIRLTRGNQGVPFSRSGGVTPHSDRPDDRRSPSADRLPSWTKEIPPVSKPWPHTSMQNKYNHGTQLETDRSYLRSRNVSNSENHRAPKEPEKPNKSEQTAEIRELNALLTSHTNKIPVSTTSPTQDATTLEKISVDQLINSIKTNFNTSELNTQTGDSPPLPAPPPPPESWSDFSSSPGNDLSYSSHPRQFTNEPFGPRGKWRPTDGSQVNSVIGCGQAPTFVPDVRPNAPEVYCPDISIPPPPMFPNFAQFDPTSQFPVYPRPGYFMDPQCGYTGYGRYPPNPYITNPYPNWLVNGVTAQVPYNRPQYPCAQTAAFLPRGLYGPYYNNPYHENKQRPPPPSPQFMGAPNPMMYPPMTSRSCPRPGGVTSFVPPQVARHQRP
ncbi:unnamed protein product [Calicophoron daubneyi]|uniref:Uncharacterized protein n=1 Tax=Calicophoron daubneyi TaxID=300641 RepID=A0AAV2TAE8_CALDB